MADYNPLPGCAAAGSARRVSWALDSDILLNDGDGFRYERSDGELEWGGAVDFGDGVGSGDLSLTDVEAADGSMSEQDQDHKTEGAMIQPLGGRQDVKLASHRPRKGHKKSRQGCYTCKRRKVKCPENHPICNNCTKNSLSCIYPSATPAQNARVVYIQQPGIPLLSSNNLQSTSIVFKASDMRLFHYFITSAYPYLPLGNDTVWVNDIASFDHSYDYLLYSILALAAAHLNMISPFDTNMMHTALSYRVIAIRTLNEALSRPPKSAAESDAMLATCFALTFQLSYLDESIEEFLTMLRGCALVFKQGWGARYGTAFLGLDQTSQLGYIEQLKWAFPSIEREFVEAAQASLEKIRELCNQDETCRRFYEGLWKVADCLSTSSCAAYIANRDLHLYMGSLSHADFQTFTSPSNTPAQVLLGHYVAMGFLMAPINEANQLHNLAPRNCDRMFFVKPIRANIPEHLEEYMRWPLEATGAVDGIPSYVERSMGERWISRNIDRLGGSVHTWVYQ